jgi:hypothetical protein
MRSRSSVLSHIFGSNPEILGYRELHINYSGYGSVLKMHDEITGETQDKKNYRFLYDKILHNYQLSDKTLRFLSPKNLLLLREPEGTIKSIIKMAHLVDNQKLQDQEQATHYYIKRLSELEILSERLSGKFYFLESDDLIDHSSEVLQRLSQWLDLKTALKEEYKTFSRTGKAGHGDPGNNIKSGQLKKTKGYPELQLSQKTLSKAVAAFELCKTTLRKRSEDFFIPHQSKKLHAKVA